MRLKNSRFLHGTPSFEWEGVGGLVSGCGCVHANVCVCVCGGGVLWCRVMGVCVCVSLSRGG